MDPIIPAPPPSPTDGTADANVAEEILQVLNNASPGQPRLKSQIKTRKSRHSNTPKSDLQGSSRNFLSIQLPADSQTSESSAAPGKPL